MIMQMQMNSNSQQYTIPTFRRTQPIGTTATTTATMAKTTITRSNELPQRIPPLRPPVGASDMIPNVYTKAAKSLPWTTFCTSASSGQRVSTAIIFLPTPPIHCPLLLPAAATYRTCFPKLKTM